MTKGKAIDTLAEFFTEEGKILSYAEYRSLPVAPVRMQELKRLFGSWRNIHAKVARKMQEPQFQEKKVVVETEDTITKDLGGDSGE